MLFEVPVGGEHVVLGHRRLHAVSVRSRTGSLCHTSVPNPTPQAVRFRMLQGRSLSAEIAFFDFFTRRAGKECRAGNAAPLCFFIYGLQQAIVDGDVDPSG